MTMNEYDSPGLVQHLGGKATAPHREGWGTSVGRLRQWYVVPEMTAARISSTDMPPGASGATMVV